MKKYSTELKEKVVKLHLSEGRSMASLEKENVQNEMAPIPQLSILAEIMRQA